MFAVCWLLVVLVGCSLFVVCCLLFSVDVVCVMRVARCCLLFACRSVCYCSLFAACCLFVVRCVSLFVSACCLFFAVC